MALPQTLPNFTPEEYLDYERAAENRHEYLDGLVYAMAGESPEHSTICFNLAVIIGNQLIGKPCRGYSPNMKARTDESGLFSYPDLMIVCGEPRFHDGRRDVITNPTTVFEVLSRSTAKYDRTTKSGRYRTQIETLRNFILIRQDRPHFEHYSLQADGTWTQNEISGLDATLELPSIECRIALREVYRLVDLQSDL